jgi:hypothetical protein
LPGLWARHFSFVAKFFLSRANPLLKFNIRRRIVTVAFAAQ